MTTTTPTTALADMELPPLPEPKYCADDLADIFTTEQMQQYARDAIAASRRAAGGEVLDCPACKGSGEGVQMVGAGPDAYEEPCNCQHCGGTGHLLDAYNGVVKLLEAERQARISEGMKALFATPAPASAGQADEVARLREDLDLANEHLRQAVESIAMFRAGTHPERAGQAAPALVDPHERELAHAANSPVPIKDSELAAFHRFCDCCEDFDSGGHDVDKAMMSQLVRIGLVRPAGPGRHETTKFGDWLRDAAQPAEGAGQAGQVAKLAEKIAAHEKPLDAESRRLFNENSWDMYVTERAAAPAEQTSAQKGGA